MTVMVLAIVVYLHVCIRSIMVVMAVVVVVSGECVREKKMRCLGRLWMMEKEGGGERRGEVG